MRQKHASSRHTTPFKIKQSASEDVVLTVITLGRCTRSRLKSWTGTRRCKTSLIACIPSCSTKHLRSPVINAINGTEIIVRSTYQKLVAPSLQNALTTTQHEHSMPCLPRHRDESRQDLPLRRSHPPSSQMPFLRQQHLYA